MCNLAELGGNRQRWMLDQHLLEVAPRVAGGMFSYLFWGANGNNFTAPVPPLGTQIDDPVGAADHVEVVFSYSKSLVGI